MPEDSPIREVITSRRWDVLVTFAENSSSMILKEFLANVDRDTVAQQRVSWVRGKEVSFSSRTIERFLETSFDQSRRCEHIELFNLFQPTLSKLVYNEHIDQYADTVRRGITGLYTAWKPKLGLPAIPEKLRRHDLTGEAAFWHQFINSTVLPSTNLTDVNVERATLLYVLLRDQNLNIANVLSSRILRMIQDGSSKSWLAHSSLITHLCEAAGVVILPEEVKDVRPATSLTHKSYTDALDEARREQIVRAADIPDDVLAQRSPRVPPRAIPEQEDQPGAPIIPPPPTSFAPASSSSAARGALHEPLYEDSPSYLHLQEQMEQLMIHSRRMAMQGDFHSQMLMDLCRAGGIDFSAYQPQYPTVPPPFVPPAPHASPRQSPQQSPPLTAADIPAPFYYDEAGTFRAPGRDDMED